MSDLFDSISEWMAHPFQSDDMDLLEWIAFTGVIVIAGYLWVRVAKAIYD